MMGEWVGDHGNLGDVLGKLVDMILRCHIEAVAAQVEDAVRMAEVKVARAQNLNTNLAL